MTNSILDNAAEMRLDVSGEVPTPAEVAEAFQTLLERWQRHHPCSSDSTLLVLADDLAWARASQFGDRIDCGARITARQSVNLEVTESFRILQADGRGWPGPLWVCTGPDPVQSLSADAVLRIQRKIDGTDSWWQMSLRPGHRRSRRPAPTVITGLIVESALGGDLMAHRREFTGTGHHAAAEPAAAAQCWVGSYSPAGHEPAGENPHSQWGQLVSGALDQARVPASARIAVLGAGQYTAREVQPRANHRFGVPSRIPVSIAGGDPVTMPIHTVSHACASTLYAIELACWMLADERLDAVVIAAVSTPSVAAESSMQAVRALSNTAARPFAANRSGITLGAGAGALVLQTPSRATAPHLARIRQVATRVAAPTPSSQAALDVHAVLETAFRGTPYPDAVIAHATGTPVGDPVELEALAKQLHRAPMPVPVVSHKGATGHLLHASGLLGICHAVSLLGRQQLHGSWGLEETTRLGMALGVAGSGSAATVHTMPQTARSVAVNALGFGGNTACVVLDS